MANRSSQPFNFSNSVFANHGMSLEQAQIVWGGLKKAIYEIQNNNASSLRFEELYRNSYTLVLHKHGDLLYDGVTEAVTKKLLETQAVVSETHVGLLDCLIEVWELHKLVMTMIRDILMYMDKTFCKLQKKTPVYDLGLWLFRDKIIRHTSIGPRMLKDLLENIRLHRIGERIDRQMMKNALMMLVEVNVYGRHVYVEDFENEFLRTTQLFYKQESQEFLANNTVQDYLKKVEERIIEEDSRCNDYLDIMTKKKLMAVLDQEMITNYAEALVENPNTGCRFMFDHNRIPDLKRMYTLFSRVPSTLDFLRTVLNSHVKFYGDQIVQDQENIKDPMKFVQDVLDLRAQYFTIAETSFLDLATQQTDRHFARVLKEAFESFINRDSRAARYLSMYLDEMLRKGLKEVADSEVDDKLENVIIIFRYISDKDVFEEYYKKHLANRLLLGKRLSDDVERLMISKLRTECGHQFTAKLENMFKDMTFSEQTMLEFRASSLNSSFSDSFSPELSVSVLTCGSWPLPQLPPCHIPIALSTSCDSFKRFYINRYSGRRLQWLTSHGSAELKCVFEKGTKELHVHTYQMCILMLYNQDSSFTYRQIQELTCIPDSELKRHLLSLAHPKVKVLNKTPSSKEVQDSHVFEWNTAYASPLYRVKIPLMSSESVEEKSAAPAEELPEVRQARTHSVEASVVRIMKARKTLEHNQLIIEVTKQLAHRFSVDALFIKKRIEDLIEKEYLERDKTDRKVYHYLA